MPLAGWSVPAPPAVSAVPVPVALGAFLIRIGSPTAGDWPSKVVPEICVTEPLAIVKVSEPVVAATTDVLVDMPSSRACAWARLIPSLGLVPLARLVILLLPADRLPVNAFAPLAIKIVESTSAEVILLALIN